MSTRPVTSLSVGSLVRHARRDTVEEVVTADVTIVEGIPEGYVTTTPAFGEGKETTEAAVFDAELVFGDRQIVSDRVQEEPAVVLLEFAQSELDARIGIDGPGAAYGSVEDIETLAEIEAALRLLQNRAMGATDSQETSQGGRSR